ncbi:ABC transporter substrate-binding protein [Petroclostridium xylanilyticum]|uniref:ABC transporter substrate-binding protein n=1 Tax=Petroclostridium xylanilyticum TaxID=1792311 RepID=UPI000B98AF68|nr:ABC transporter substrate-binding protein [Petroclostridium xylanilyticum]
MQVKKTISIILVYVLCFSLLAGCGQKKDAVSQNDTKQAENQTEEKTDTQEKLEPIEFTMFCYDRNENYENFESPVAQKIKEKTGVTLKIEYPVGDPEQKIGVMLASGEYPDFIFAKTSQTKFISSGIFLKLDDLIEKHGPNIKKLYGDYLKRLRYSLEDPSIYVLGTYGVYEEKWEPEKGFQLQHAVVKELGFPKLKTLKDFEEAIKAYMVKHPTIDGQPTIPLSLIADDWRLFIGVENPAVFATGGPDDGHWYVDPETQEATLHFFRPEEREYFRWLNHMNNVGLLDPESFVQKYDQYIAKIASGRVLALADAYWNYHWNAEMTLKQDGKEERMYGMYPLVLNEGIKIKEFQSPGYSAGWGIGITNTVKDPVRAIKFFDFLASDEGQILTHWGIEGVHYNIVNGKRVLTEEQKRARREKNFSKETGVGVYGYPFPERGVGATDETGQLYTPTTKETIKEGYTDIEKEVLTAYGVEMWMDLYPSRNEFPVKPWGAAWQINLPGDSEAQVIFTKCEDIMKKRLPQAILAKPADFDKAYDAFLAELKAAGAQKLEQEFNKLLKERIQLWNK